MKHFAFNHRYLQLPFANVSASRANGFYGGSIFWGYWNERPSAGLCLRLLFVTCFFNVVAGRNGRVVVVKGVVAITLLLVVMLIVTEVVVDIVVKVVVAISLLLVVVLIVTEVVVVVVVVVAATIVLQQPHSSSAATKAARRAIFMSMAKIIATAVITLICICVFIFFMHIVRWLLSRGLPRER